MEIEINITKSVEQNAEEYYAKIKKFKKKLNGVKEAIERTDKRLEKAQKDSRVVKEEKVVVKRKEKWYEKFRWFIASSGFLVVGGRDATSNEIVIKKHTDPEDVVFHTEMPGSPFVVIKTKGEKVDKQTIDEVAVFTASYSKAWKLGLRNTEVFHVSPEQVSKTAQSGEYIAKGAFMIYGKKNIIATSPGLAICLLQDGTVMSGPLSAVKKQTENFVEIEQGNEKTSAIAKKIQKRIGSDIDSIIRVIPPGSKLKK